MTNRLVFGGTSSLFIIAVLVASTIGAVSIPLRAFVGDESVEMYAHILWHIRLPRVALAALIGASLALSGAVLQSLLRNPLADPFTLGVSSGAAVGAVGAISVGLTTFGIWTIPVMSIVGALVTLAFVLLITTIIDPLRKMETVLLVGVMTSSFLSAVISLIIALTHEELRSIVYWLMGSVSMKGWTTTWIVAPLLLIVGVFVLKQAGALNAFGIGEAEAHIVGVNTRRVTWGLLIAVSLLTGTAVAFSGMVGFVGLVIPHIVRTLVGVDHRMLLPLVAVNGATFLVVADFVSRTIIAPSELPLGVVTSLVGVPIFAFIYVRMRRKELAYVTRS